jgi:chemotaxis protein histidine kinase CheA
MADNKPSAEIIAKWKSRVKDPSTDEKSKETFKNLLKKWGEDVEDVVKKVGEEVVGKKQRKPRKTKPKATNTSSAEDVEKAKAEIKKKTGKTEEECETIIEQYRALRTKAQERKAKDVKASDDNKKRVEKLEKKGDIIEGTNEKTADAVIETAKVDVVEKIEKEIEKVEEKAEVDAKREVEKEMPKESATEKKKAVAEKVEEKVKEKTKVVVKRVIVDTTAMIESIATKLAEFDKESQKEFLIKLRSDIEKLLTKFAFGGEVSGATQGYNITQSNLSSSSVNMFAGGGSTYQGGEIDEYIVIHTSMKPESFIKKHKLSNYEYEIDETDYDGFHRINFETYPKNQDFLKDKSIMEFYYEPYEEYAGGGYTYQGGGEIGGLVQKIRNFVKSQDGSVTLYELDSESLILDKEEKDEEWMIERLNYEDVTIVKYVHGQEVAENVVQYSQLPKNVLKEIVEVIEDSTYQGGGEIKLDDNVFIVENLDDHKGYKKGQLVNVISIDEDGMLLVESKFKDKNTWYVSEDEVVKRNYAKGGSTSFKGRGANIDMAMRKRRGM